MKSNLQSHRLPRVHCEVHVWPLLTVFSKRVFEHFALANRSSKVQPFLSASCSRTHRFSFQTMATGRALMLRPYAFAAPKIVNSIRRPPVAPVPATIHKLHSSAHPSRNRRCTDNCVSQPSSPNKSDCTRRNRTLPACNRFRHLHPRN